MSLLEVSGLSKTYTTRFGGNQVQALSCVNFSVEEGEYVAIMGESGSGKTTLLNILAALDRPTSGEVLLEGKSITHLTEKEISVFRRKNLGFVFQDFNLLDTFSLRDNIYLPLVLAGEDYQEMEQKIRPIAKALHIDQLLEKFPYEVSGGQKQRLSIARAIAKKPEIFIFDDSFSALDFKTDSTLRKALKEHTKDATTIIVAQRISTILNADKIIVLDDGRMAGIGTHEELLKDCPIYQEIYYSQFPKEAVING